MFDLGMMELLVIGVVALIVVGPKDLPIMFRTVGRYMGRMRGMARDFQRAMNDAADDAGVRDIDRDLRRVASARKLGLDDVKEAARSMADVDRDLKRGPETTKLAEERAEASRRIRDAAAERAARKAAEGADAEPPPPVAAPEPAGEAEPAPAQARAS